MAKPIKSIHEYFEHLLIGIPKHMDGTNRSLKW